MKKSKKKAKKKIVREKPKKRQIEALPGTFMLTGMLGFIITVIYTSSGKISLDYGVAFCIVFLIMFLASIKSIMPSGKI